MDLQFETKGMIVEGVGCIGIGPFGRVRREVQEGRWQQPRDLDTDGGWRTMWVAQKPELCDELERCELERRFQAEAQRCVEVLTEAPSTFQPDNTLPPERRQFRLVRWRLEMLE